MWRLSTHKMVAKCIVAETTEMIFLKNNIWILKKRGTQNWHWNLASQAVFKLQIKMVKILFWSIAQELLSLLEF